jgi:hypothetical protein
MPSGIKTLLGTGWKPMAQIEKGITHTFILPPGGYRIAVESTDQRYKLRNWYGEGSGTWLPFVVSEGQTVYLTYKGDRLSW